MARPFGSDHNHVEIRTRLNLFEMDVEAVCKRERRPFPDVGLDLVSVDVGVMLVREKNHHDIGTAHGLRHFFDHDPRVLCFVPGGSVLAQPDGHFGARVFQIVRVRMTL
jgi:hypothetical protein